MERHAAAAVAQPGSTPRTEAATFVVSALDVGTKAVRPGCMEEIEHERDVLLKAARLVLARIKARNTNVGATYEFMLEAAIRVAEAVKP